MTGLLLVLALGTGVAAFWLTGRVRHYAIARDLLDHPNQRSSHVTATPRGGGMAIVVTTIAALLLAGFRLTGARGVTYQQVLSVVAHAGVILLLRQVIAAPIVYARETLASPVTLNLFFTVIDEASPPARFLAAVDLFVVWWIIVIAMGMSALYGRPARRLAIIFVGLYALLAAVVTAAMALTGGTA